MIFKSVRIQNFKCIEDSEEFTLDRVTCLVGKNEAGKSAILEALYKLKPVVKEHANFNDIIEYPRKDWNEYRERRKQEPANVLTTVWELEENDAKLVEGVLGPNALRSPTVTITKGYDNRQRWAFEIDEGQVISNCMKGAGLYAEELQQAGAAKSVPELVKHLTELPSPSERQTALLSTLQTTFGKGTTELAAASALSQRLPTFLYFYEYWKMPGQVSINELRAKQQQNTLTNGERIFLALLDLAGTTPDGIDGIKKFEEFVAELEGVSNRITKTIFEYWSQNRHLRVQFRLDLARPEDPAPYNTGNVFRTRIENLRHAVTVGFDERSSGFVWFFSFLVWFSQVRKNFGENLFILLDEPGLGLHAKAQQDLLRFVDERLKPNYQTIYSAHSPFMVDPEKLLSARTVEDVVKDDQILGTKVGDKVFSTDADTLFPLQAALGYDITQTMFIGKHVLLVEGPADLLYLKWFSKELKTRKGVELDPRWVITPCGGLDKVGSFLALFGANKLHVAVLTDFHSGQRKKVRDLKESVLLKAGHVFSAEMYAGQSEADVEDMMGRPFYVELVNECYSLEDKRRLPDVPNAGAPPRVVKEVEEHFATLPPETPEFDHLGPAVYLLENGADLRNRLSGLNVALERFERFFRDVNTLLPADT